MHADFLLQADQESAIKRFHVHVNVDRLDDSIRFYTTLFGIAPNIVKSDYAKWMLDDPRVNFAISQHCRPAGIDHLGIQAEETAEWTILGERLQVADAVALTEKRTTCCYARSDKLWANDPQGVRWETFHTLGEATTYTSMSTEAETSVYACSDPAASSSPTKTCGPGAPGACC